MSGLQKKTRHIGSLNEKSLHLSLKEWYAETEDEFEVLVDGYVIDIVRDSLLIEIQTQNFSSLKKKIIKLTKQHQLRLVYPVAREKWLVKLPNDQVLKAGYRKSPKKGKFEHVFKELVSFPQLLSNANFSLEILLIKEEEIRCFDGKKGWRKKGWVTQERKLLEVVERKLFENPKDFLFFIPKDLQSPFTTLDLSLTLKIPRALAQKMAYCLREMNVIMKTGKIGNAILYESNDFGTIAK